MGASAFDALDGGLARRLGRPTQFGAFLDSALDRVSEAAVFLGIAWWYMGQVGPWPEMLAFAALFGSLMVSYTRARAEGLGIDCKVGILTRVERCLVLIAGLVLNLVIPALAAGTLYTTVQRIWHVYRLAGDKPLES
jgi:CDP-diacylglycerol--glycerol-3-phosphate 3-phosphatidyltransferase